MKGFEYWRKLQEEEAKAERNAEIHYYMGKQMDKNTKYDWCNDRTGNIKEFLGWIYARLQSKGDNFNDSHMVKLDSFIAELPGTIPSGPPLSPAAAKFKAEMLKIGYAVDSIGLKDAMLAFDMAMKY